MLPFESRGLMDPANSKPNMYDMRGKNIVLDGLRDPKSFFMYYTYNSGIKYYTKEYLDKRDN